MEEAVAPGSTVGDEELAGLEAQVVDLRPAYLADLERLVNVDCGTYTKVGVDEVGRWTADQLTDLGGDVVSHPDKRFGETRVATFDGEPGGPRLLLIGHLDTVFPEGTAAARPFSIVGGRAFGPGVTDMKSGLLAGLVALRALTRQAAGRMAGPPPFERLIFIANPDEEVGSPVSSPIIRELAAEADACLVLECARANGDIVSSRKGTVDLRFVVHGRAAHAGVEPEKGRSAILEAAHEVVALHGLNGRWPGVTCNVGTFAGGSRPNVVAESATFGVDLRATTREALEAAEAAVRQVAGRPAVPETTTTVEELSRHWPMEKLPRSVRLVEHAQALAGRLGFEVRDTATGGASDANTTAGMGVATLDGLGPIGGLDHSPDEYLELDSIVPRTTLLAALILAIARDPQVAAWRGDRG